MTSIFKPQLSVQAHMHMQDNRDTHPQALSQEEPVSNSINHASISPSRVAPHTSQMASHASQHCEESSLGLGPAAIQLLLLVIILYTAHIQYPKLHPGFLVACASAFILLLVRNSRAAARHTGHKPPAANQPTQATQQQARQHTSQPRTPNLTGVWIKDKAASDSMDPTLHLMKVNRLIRSAVGLVKGTQLNQSDNSFEITVLSGILWFKIREQYPLTGEVQRFKRRDLRKGLHRGTAEKLPDGAVCVTLEWDEPLGGIGTDVFYSPAPKLLYVDSTILMHGQTVKYRTVYNKQQ